MVQSQENEQLTYFIRQEKDRNYTVMNNTFLRDTRLSWKAKGLFAYILSLPSNWKIYQSELIKHSTDGITSFRTAKKELIELGYIKQSRSSINGTFVWCYLVVENPEEEKTKVETELPKEKTEVKKEKVEKKARTSLLEREPVNDIEKVEKAYLLNYKSLYQKGIVSSAEPIVNWIQARSLLKTWLNKYSVEIMLSAIEKSLGNDFVVSNGYSLTMILSAGVLSSLINGGGKTQKQGFSTGQGVDRFNPEMDFDF